MESKSGDCSREQKSRDLPLMAHFDDDASMFEKDFAVVHEIGEADDSVLFSPFSDLDMTAGIFETGMQRTPLQVPATLGISYWNTVSPCASSDAAPSSAGKIDGSPNDSGRCMAWIYKQTTHFFMKERLMGPPEQKVLTGALGHPIYNVFEGDVGVQGPLGADGRLVECGLLESEHKAGIRSQVPPGNVMAAVQEIWPGFNETTRLPLCTKFIYPRGDYYEIGRPVAKPALTLTGKKRSRPDSERPFQPAEGTGRVPRASKASSNGKQTKEQLSRWAIAFQEHTIEDLDSYQTSHLSTGLPSCLAHIVANVFLRRGPGGRPLASGNTAAGNKKGKRPAPFVRLWLPKA